MTSGTAVVTGYEDTSTALADETFIRETMPLAWSVASSAPPTTAPVARPSRS